MDKVKKLKRYRAFAHIPGSFPTESSDYGVVIAYSFREALEIARSRAHKAGFVVDRIKLLRE